MRTRLFLLANGSYLLIPIGTAYETFEPTITQGFAAGHAAGQLRQLAERLEGTTLRSKSKAAATLTQTARDLEACQMRLLEIADETTNMITVGPISYIEKSVRDVGVSLGDISIVCDKASKEES